MKERNAKKILIVSHCVLNNYCELPEATSAYRKEIVDYALDNDISILQLPCPELSYQSLERNSIYPGTSKAIEYEKYCRKLLDPTIHNIKEYHKHGIEIVGIVGVDTSPSCSVVDREAIMMKILLSILNAEGVNYGILNDMPAL